MTESKDNITASLEIYFVIVERVSLAIKIISSLAQRRIVAVVLVAQSHKIKLCPFD